MTTKLCPVCSTSVPLKDGQIPRHKRDGERCPGGEQVQYLSLPWARPPLSLNDRMHHMARYRIEQDIQTTVRLLARNAKLTPVAHAYVTLHYRPRDDRRRDKDNLFGTIKPVLDGLRDAGLVPDDSADYVTPMPPVIHPSEAGMPGGLWLTIEEAS